MRETIFDIDLKKRKISKLALTSDNLTLVVGLKSGQLIEYDIIINNSLLLKISKYFKLLLHKRYLNYKSIKFV